MRNGPEEMPARTGARIGRATRAPMDGMVPSGISTAGRRSEKSGKQKGRAAVRRLALEKIRHRLKADTGSVTTIAAGTAAAEAAATLAAAEAAATTATEATAVTAAKTAAVVTAAAKAATAVGIETAFVAESVALVSTATPPPSVKTHRNQ